MIEVGTNTEIPNNTLLVCLFKINNSMMLTIAAILIKPIMPYFAINLVTASTNSAGFISSEVLSSSIKNMAYKAIAIAINPTHMTTSTNASDSINSLINQSGQPQSCGLKKVALYNPLREDLTIVSIIRNLIRRKYTNNVCKINNYG